MMGKPFNTQIISVNPVSPESDKIENAAMMIKDGGLVAFPTETVYGIGADHKNESAKKRLYQIKNRPLDKPFTLHISDLSQIKDAAGVLPDYVKDIASRFWPGPLTILINSVDGSKLGFRMPRNKVALCLISACARPLVTPSANLSGEPPARNANEVMNVFNGMIEMILDGGDVELGVESTVLDLTTTPFSLLREGAISSDDLQKMGLPVSSEYSTGIKNILLVCTGNSCRSVMAEGLFKALLKDRIDCTFTSAGIFAIPGLPPTQGAEIVMREIGVDVSRHRSRLLNLDMVAKADLILAMTEMHKEHIEQTYPEYKHKVFLISEYGNLQKPGFVDIPDPVGKPLEVYEECLRILREHVERVVKLL
ncbi:MAG: threonylcarbamoyl-AMP synthase [Candidatus Omnitrophica bacterium]|nr:threonylcarbamoyl-AMP synthase [Candidatus Omnitrophota bacterium]